jgi:hypothetical protein
MSLRRWGRFLTKLIFNAWFSRIAPESLMSRFVEASVAKPSGASLAITQRV